MGKILTTVEAKAILQISGSYYDNTIEVLIPIVEDFVIKYCNLTDDSASLAAQPALKLAASNLINYQIQVPSNISSETIGNYSVSYTNSYPANILDTLRPFRKAGFIQDIYSLSWQEDLLEDFRI